MQELEKTDVHYAILIRPGSYVITSNPLEFEGFQSGRIRPLFLYSNDKERKCHMRRWGIAIEGVSVERRKALKMAKKWQKTHKNTKKVTCALAHVKKM